MNSVSPDSRSAELEPAKPAGMDALLWNEATAEQKLVLLRIAKQRARIKARAAAKAQTLALRRTATPHVDAGCSLARAPVVVRAPASAGNGRSGWPAHGSGAGQTDSLGQCCAALDPQAAATYARLNSPEKQPVRHMPDGLFLLARSEGQASGSVQLQ